MILKADKESRPNNHGIPTQHIATLFGATCCVCLATMLRCVVLWCCWELLVQVWKWSNLSQQHPTCHNRSQQDGQMHATCCTPQYCNMLRWHVVTVWPGLCYSSTLTVRLCCPLPANRFHLKSKKSSYMYLFTRFFFWFLIKYQLRWYWVWFSNSQRVDL